MYTVKWTKSTWHRLLPFIAGGAWSRCIQVSDCCAVAHVLIKVYIWLELFCCLLLALLPFYFRLNNHITKDTHCCSWNSCVLYFQCGRALQRRLFCCAAFTLSGMLHGQTEMVLTDFKHPYVSFLFLRRGKKKKRRGEKTLENRGNGDKWPSVFLLYWESPSERHMQLWVRVESSMPYRRHSVIWNKGLLSWVPEGENCLWYGFDVIEELWREILVLR